MVMNILVLAEFVIHTAAMQHHPSVVAGVMGSASR
jgi:hypothetical protein